MVSKRSVASALVLSLVFASLFAGVFLAFFGEAGFSAGCCGEPGSYPSYCLCPSAEAPCPTSYCSGAKASNCIWSTSSSQAGKTKCLEKLSAPAATPSCYCPTGTSPPGPTCQWTTTQPASTTLYASITSEALCTGSAAATGKCYCPNSPPTTAPNAACTWTSDPQPAGTTLQSSATSQTACKGTSSATGSSCFCAPGGGAGMECRCKTTTPASTADCNWVTTGQSSTWGVFTQTPSGTCLDISCNGCVPAAGQLCYCNADKSDCSPQTITSTPPTGYHFTTSRAHVPQTITSTPPTGYTACTGGIPSTCPIRCASAMLSDLATKAAGSTLVPSTAVGNFQNPTTGASQFCMCSGDPADPASCNWQPGTFTRGEYLPPTTKGADFTTQCMPTGAGQGLFWILYSDSNCAGDPTDPGTHTGGACLGCECCVTKDFAMATGQSPDNMCVAGPGCTAMIKSCIPPDAPGAYCTTTDRLKTPACSHGSRYTAATGALGGFCGYYTDTATARIQAKTCTELTALCMNGICVAPTAQCSMTITTPIPCATGSVCKCDTNSDGKYTETCPTSGDYSGKCYPDSTQYKTCTAPNVCAKSGSYSSTPTGKCVIMVNTAGAIIEGMCYPNAVANEKPCTDTAGQFCLAGATTGYNTVAGKCPNTGETCVKATCENSAGKERRCSDVAPVVPATEAQFAPDTAHKCAPATPAQNCFVRDCATCTGTDPIGGGSPPSGGGPPPSGGGSPPSGGGNNTYKPEGTCLSTSTMTRNCTTLDEARALVQKNEGWAESEQPCARNDACCTIEQYNAKKTICMERLGNGTNGTYYLKLDIKVTPSTADKRIKTGCEVTVNVTQNSSFECYTDEALKVKRAGVEVTPLLVSEQTAMNPCRWTWKVPVSQDGIYNFSFWNGTQSINWTQYTALASVSLTCPPANCDELCKANSSYTPTKLGCGKESCGKYQMAYSKTCSSMGACSTVTVKYCEADPTCQPEVQGSWDTINLAGTESFNLSLSANITGYTGSVTKMRFIIDNSVVSEDFGSPYAAIVGAYKAGTNHTYVATAVTADGNFSSVTYNIAIPPTIPSPTPKVLCPMNCSQYFECACNVTGCTDGGDVYIASNKMGSRMERRLNNTSQKFSFYPPFSGTQSIQAVCGENRASPILALDVLPTPLSVSVVGGSCGAPNRNACNLTIFSDKAVPFDMYVAGKASTGKGAAYSSLRRAAGTQGNMTVAFSDLRYVGASPHEITLFIYPRDANKDLPGAFIKAVYIGSVN